MAESLLFFHKLELLLGIIEGDGEVAPGVFKTDTERQEDLERYKACLESQGLEAIEAGLQYIDKIDEQEQLHRSDVTRCCIRIMRIARDAAKMHNLPDTFVSQTEERIKQKLQRFPDSRGWDQYLDSLIP